MGWPRATTSADEGADEDPSGADTPHHGHDVGPLGQRGRRRPRRWWRRHCGGDGTAVTLWWRDRAGQPAGDGQTVHSDAGSRFTSVGFAEASPSRASPPRSDRSATPPSGRVRGADRPAVSRLRPWGAGELERDGPPQDRSWWAGDQEVAGPPCLLATAPAAAGGRQRRERRSGHRSRRPGPRTPLLTGRRSAA